MIKKILVFNVGSSSIKYSLFENKKRILKKTFEELNSIKDYKKAFEKIKKELKNKNFDLIIHRIVHGGDLKKPVKINKEIKNKIKGFSKFAPLHNPKELEIINLCKKFKKPQYAVFDTMFFSDLPKVSKTYAIPTTISKKYKIQKYGFHGLSHKSVSKNLKGKTIVCHLGQGSSISAIKNKKPIDTSMGLTPLEGLMMCTRSGSIDPGLILFLQEKNYDLNKILNKESGLKGISGYSDFRKIRKNLKNKDNKLAYEMFVQDIVKYIGSYVAELNGLNNLVFTGAIGEQVPMLRKDVCKKLKFLNLKLNKTKNQKNKKIISSKDSKIKVYVVPTNEDEQMIEEVLNGFFF